MIHICAFTPMSDHKNCIPCKNGTLHVTFHSTPLTCKGTRGTVCGCHSVGWHSGVGEFDYFTLMVICTKICLSYHYHLPPSNLEVVKLCALQCGHCFEISGEDFPIPFSFSFLSIGRCVPILQIFLEDVQPKPELFFF